MRGLSRLLAFAQTMTHVHLAGNNFTETCPYPRGARRRRAQSPSHLIRVDELCLSGDSRETLNTAHTTLLSSAKGATRERENSLGTRDKSPEQIVLRDHLKTACLVPRDKTLLINVRQKTETAPRHAVGAAARPALRAHRRRAHGDEAPPRRVRRRLDPRLPHGHRRQPGGPVGRRSRVGPGGGVLYCQVRGRAPAAPAALLPEKARALDPSGAAAGDLGGRGYHARGHRGVAQISTGGAARAHQVATALVSAREASVVHGPLATKKAPAHRVEVSNQFVGQPRGVSRAGPAGLRQSGRRQAEARRAGLGGGAGGRRRRGR